MLSVSKNRMILYPCKDKNWSQEIYPVESQILSFIVKLTNILQGWMLLTGIWRNIWKSEPQTTQPTAWRLSTADNVRQADMIRIMHTYRTNKSLHICLLYLFEVVYDFNHFFLHSLYVDRLIQILCYSTGFLL